MKIFGRSSESTTPPVLVTSEDAPHRAPATPEACRGDYAKGEDARKNLGKPNS